MRENCPTCLGTFVCAWEPLYVIETWSWAARDGLQIEWEKVATGTYCNADFTLNKPKTSDASCLDMEGKCVRRRVRAREPLLILHTVRLGECRAEASQEPVFSLQMTYRNYVRAKKHPVFL